MVKDHSDSERGNLLSDKQQVVFYMHHPLERITHTTAFHDIPVMEHWLEQEIAQWGRSISMPISTEGSGISC